MRLSVKHVTAYRYSEPVVISHNLLHLSPRETPRQRVLHSDLHISPLPTLRDERTDAFGNRATHATIQEAHTRLVISSTATVEVAPLLAPPPGTPWHQVADALRAGSDNAMLEAIEFAFASPLVGIEPAAVALTQSTFVRGAGIAQASLALAQQINRDFTYDPTATHVATPLQQVLEQRRGVCQDFAHVMIAALRGLGLAARYVSGYLETEPPPGQQRLQGADASHAWVQVFDPAFGWLDVDPTNGCLPSDRHVWVAWGRDFADVSPTKGMILGGGQSVVSVEVDVLRVEEAPAVTTHGT